MRKYLLAAAALLAAAISAQAADLKTPDDVPSVFTWNAFYIGANFGGAWTRHQWTDSVFGESFNTTNNNAAFLAGGQIGSNFQFGNFVIGFEWDLDWIGNGTGNGGNGVAIPALESTFQLSTSDAWISTLSGRFGVAYDCLLFYGKAGVAWVGTNGFTLTNLTTTESIDAGGVNVNWGWLLGGGVEWAILPRWTMRVEYNYLGLNNRSFLVPDDAPESLPVGDTFLGRHRSLQTVRIGFNYLFNVGPVTAKY
jgi:outer membrane immunogenic protein